MALPSIDINSGTVINITLIGVLCLILIRIAFIDARTHTIPNRLTILIAILGILRILSSYLGATGITPVSLIDSLWGAAIAGLPLFLIAVCTDGFGGGDVKLMAAAGLFLGLRAAVLALMIGIISGGIVGLYLLATKRADRKTAIAFGPYLSLGIAFAAMWPGTNVILRTL